MTRRDYILIADALRGARPEPPFTPAEYLSQWRVDCQIMAAHLSRANPGGFDGELFMRNCGCPA